jgi:hypothetical protein
MWEKIRGWLCIPPSRFEYIRESYNLYFGEDGSDVHVVNVGGELHVYSYDDYCRTELDYYIEAVNRDAIELAKRLKLPVRYYYRTRTGTDFIHYDYRHRRFYA